MAEELPQWQRAAQNVQERIARSTKIVFEDESGSGINIIEYSEKHLHEGHQYEITETLFDNHVESTTWAYCASCEEEFWYASTEMDM